MKKITKLLTILVFCCFAWHASAQQLSDVFPVSKEALKSNTYSNSNNRALEAIYETTHEIVSFAFISPTASQGTGDGIAMGGTNRVIQEITVSLYDAPNLLTPYSLTVSLYTDCSSNGATGSACGTGPGVLIPGSSQTITVTPTTQVHQVTFLYTGLNVSSETDNEISIVLNASRTDIGWLTGVSGRTAGSRTAAEIGFGVDVFTVCGAAGANGCTRFFATSTP